MNEKPALFVNANIVTMDAARPRADAVATKGETILAVGTRDACRAAAGGGAGVLDCQGATLLPGFIDTHLHPTMLVYFDMNVDLRHAACDGDVRRMLQDAAKGLAPGEWLIGVNYDEQRLQERRLPDRHDLDAAVPDRPVVLVKRDGHSVIANTLAIEKAGANANTPDPPGGRIDREEDGFPAGPFREQAAPIVRNAIALPELDRLKDGARTSFLGLAAKGITSVGAVLQTDEEGMAGDSGHFEIAALSMLLDVIPQSLYGLVIAKDEDKLKAALASPLNKGRHRIGAVKIFADGSFGTRSALMREPFSDDPENRGMLLLAEDEIYRRMVLAHTMGLQIATHAIGDAGCRLAIDLYERLLGEHPRADHRHRIEHASVLDEAMLADMRRLGIVVSTQPLFVHSEKEWLVERLGEKRARWTYPFRSILEADVPLAGASDAPVEPADVLHAVSCCVTRDEFQPQEALTVEQALGLFTTTAAFSQFEENVKGRIAPGRRADLVALEEDPFAIEPERIAEINVVRTVCGGRTVFEG